MRIVKQNRARKNAHNIQLEMSVVREVRTEVVMSISAYLGHLATLPRSSEFRSSYNCSAFVRAYKPRQQNNNTNPSANKRHGYGIITAQLSLHPGGIWYRAQKLEKRIIRFPHACLFIIFHVFSSPQRRCIQNRKITALPNWLLTPERNKDLCSPLPSKNLAISM